MAKAPGRSATLSKNSVVLAGLRNVKISWSAETIDFTDRDSNGRVTLASVPATEQITITADGLATDPTFRNIAFTNGTSKLLTDVTFKFADALVAADTITGNFFLTTNEEDNPHDAEATFALTLVSSGDWTLG